MATTPHPIRVNRAPVLTLWATVVAERLGYPPETPRPSAGPSRGPACARRPALARLASFANSVSSDYPSEITEKLIREEVPGETADAEERDEPPTAARKASARQHD